MMFLSGAGGDSEDSVPGSVAIKSEELFIRWATHPSRLSRLLKEVSLLKQGTWTCPPAGSWRETSQPSASPLASPLPSRPASPSILRTTDLLPGNGADSPGSAAKPGTAAGGEGTSHTAATPSPSATASSKPGRSPRPRSAPGSRKGSADQLRALGAQLPNLRTLLQPHSSITRDGVNPAKLFGSSGKVKLPEFRRAFTKLYALPSCLATSFFHAANNGDLSTSLLTLANFEAFARQLPSSPAEVLVYVLRPGATGFGPADLKPFVEAILQTHPGLEFLADAPEFGPRYVETVVARIFYSVNVTRTDRITAREVRRSDLLEALHHLDAEPDINNVLQYFSYQHFYVIYTTFWKLDLDHDMMLSRVDLARYGNDGLSTKAIERVVELAALNPWAVKANYGNLSYRDFVCFMLSEEDKLSPRGVYFWFCVLDLDGDGIIDQWEMQQFFNEQKERMEVLAVESMTFEDCLCQMYDCVQTTGPISLKTLKKCKQADIFVNTFVNINKYLDHEEHDPFAQDDDEKKPTAWNKFAAAQYDVLAAEEDEQDGWSGSEDEY